MVRASLVSSLSSVTKDWDDGISYGKLCDRIELITGIERQSMKILFNLDTGVQVEIVESESPYPFKAYPNVSTILVQDLNENSVVNQLQNESSKEIQGFELSDEDYAKRSDSVLQWKMKNGYGRFNPEWENLQQQQRDSVKKLKVGQRCRVKTDGQPERRGWLRFVGPLGSANHNGDTWCGIEFDEAVGKNDGSFEGQTYFGPVKPNHGGFVKAVRVESGEQFVPLGNSNQSEDEL